jgi:hypothetical protein
MRAICRLMACGIETSVRAGIASGQAFHYRVGPPAERHNITAFSVSGLRESLISTPSWTMRHPSAAASVELDFLQLGLRRADDVASTDPALLRQNVGAGHAATADAKAPRRPMSGLHGDHDRLQGPRS